MSADINKGKLYDYKNSLNMIEGFVGASVVETRGSTHIVVATTQAIENIGKQCGVCDGVLGAIKRFGEHYGFRVNALPFADCDGYGICYDIVVRPLLVA